MRLFTGFRILLVVGALSGTACSNGRVAARVTIPDESGVETPLAGIRVTFHPYDRDSILAELARAAPPRPSTEPLDSLFQAFRTPFTAYLRLNAALERARRTLQDAPGAALADSIARLEREVERARVVLAEARQRLQPGIDSLRQVLLAWEDTAFGPYDTLSATLTRRRGIVFDTTGADGWLEVRLPRGTWWAVARAVNIQDPYAEWYWNVPVAGDTVILNPANGRNRPRIR